MSGWSSIRGAAGDGRNQTQKGRFDMPRVHSLIEQLIRERVAQRASAPAEIIEYEALGLCRKGEGGRLIASGVIALGGRIPVNTSGGLLRKGHPVGATGVAQIVELTEQLQGRAGRRQVQGARLAACGPAVYARRMCLLDRVLLLVMAFALWATAAAPAELPPRLLRGGPGGDTTVILASHNQYRQRHCAPRLAWSEELAHAAQTWAERLARDCTFKHSSSKYGENLWMGTAGAFGPQQVVGAWYGEGTGYDYRHPGFFMSTGHFTQLVWGATHRLGCGTAICKGNQIWVCNYDPPGNAMGQFRENVLPATCRR